jgi:NADP-dependent 3-hydroxy acid dehydrogenase YdfG
VQTELLSHNTDAIQEDLLEPFNRAHERLVADDIADGVTFMVTRPRRAAVAEMLVLPTEQS